jgi:cyclic pyranopterin phosphate synthase
VGISPCGRAYSFDLAFHFRIEAKGSLDRRIKFGRGFAGRQHTDPKGKEIMSELSHYDESGRVKMVDILGKQTTARRAVASGKVLLSAETLDILKNKTNPKGDPLEIARIAGIMAAKQTPSLIPLCHQINLSGVNVTAAFTDDGISLTAEALTDAQTGVEMEALTAISIAALTIYDMCKAVQKDIVISDVRLVSKTGGKSDYQASNG